MLTIDRIRELKSKYKGDPARGRRDFDDAQARVEEINQKINRGVAMTKTEVREVNDLIDLIEYLSTPTEQPAGLEDPGAGPYGGGGYGDTSIERRFGEFMQKVAAANLPPGGKVGNFRTGVIDSSLYDTRASGLQEAIPSQGGFLVDKTFESEILSKSFQNGKLLNRVRKFEIGANSNGIKIPYIDETSRANGSRSGGTRGYWLSEAGSKTASKPKLGQVEMSLEKLIGLCYATDELLEDSTVLGQVLLRDFSEELTFKIEDALINGTGAGQPLGIVSSGALVSVGKETGQTATTLVYENVMKMYARYWSKGRGVVLANADIIPQLFKMSVAVGTGGIPVYMPANGISRQPFDSLYGLPILYMEQCPTLGQPGDLIFCDPEEYILIQKGGLQSASSIHVQFTTDETTFRFVWRVNGQPWWTAPLTPYKGTGNTVSPFVTTAVRE